jgi:UDP-glucose 4-epimerase
MDDLSEVAEFSVVSTENCSSSHGVVLIEGDIRDQNTVNLCAENVDCIIHLAANTGVAPSVENPRMDMESNVIGTFNVLEAARKNKVKKFIFASSGAPAGMVTPPIHEELPPHPVSPYGASKLAGEGYCSAYYHTFGINTVCLRFGNVYGPRSKNKSSVVAKFIRQSLAGEICHIYGDGTQTRDFIYIDDLVNAIVLSLFQDIGGETFQIASGIEKTVGEVANIIKGVLGRHGRDMTITHESPRIGDVKRNYSDTSKAKKILGWHPLTDLQSGIENTVKYFIDMTNE